MNADVFLRGIESLGGIDALAEAIQWNGSHPVSLNQLHDALKGG